MRSASTAVFGGLTGVLWVARRITATLAASGPIASTPAETVLACAETLLLVKSFAILVNSFLNASALLGDIVDVTRSIVAVGLCGLNVADASAVLLAMPTTSALSLRSARSGTVHRRYPTATAATKAAVATATTANRKPGPSSSVPAVTASRRARAKFTTTPSTISTHSTEQTDTHHSGHASAMPMYTSAATAATGARMSKASTRQRFLIGSAPTER